MAEENQHGTTESGAVDPATLLFGDWSQIPYGLCLIRMRHESMGGAPCLHLHMKMNEGKWYDQPHVPAAYSQESTKDSHIEFWQWAAENLPTWDYPELVKSHG